ncbi:MAG: helix-turn-helix domain-containing protein [Chitinophagaceae bacterium]
MPAKLDNIDLKLKSAIAARFKDIRQKTGTTQQNFAHSSGRDKQSYSKNERGKGASIYTINKFCVENNMTLSDFFNSESFATLKPKNK